MVSRRTGGRWMAESRERNRLACKMYLCTHMVGGVDVVSERKPTGGAKVASKNGVRKSASRSQTQVVRSMQAGEKALRKLTRAYNAIAKKNALAQEPAVKPSASSASQAAPRET
jgi:hypothetical protein